MARPLRHLVPGLPVHLIQRGNNRQPCFFCQRDYIVYLGKLDEYRKTFDVAIHSFVLMTNHVHLLATPGDSTGLSRMLQALGAYYVRYINSSQGRTGTLWEGRFKASMIDSDQYFFTVSRYVELNPVRAGIVANPATYPWSSYHMNALGKRISLLTPHALYLALGPSDADRQAVYRSFFAQDIPGSTLDAIRNSASAGHVVGDGRFKAAVERHLGFPIPPFPRGGARLSGES